jgi:hypothetical protein
MLEWGIAAFAPLFTYPFAQGGAPCKQEPHLSSAMLFMPVF